MAELTGTQRRLANALYDVGAIQFGEFKLKHHETQPNAPLSPVLLNLRTPDDPERPKKKHGPITPEIVDMVAQELMWIVCEKDLGARQICGIPNAGDPFAERLWHKMHGFHVKLMTLMKSENGSGRKVTGIQKAEYGRNDRVILVDDLITKADSKFEAIDAIESAGLVVHDLLVLVDREQGGREQLESKGYTLHAAFTLTQLLDFYVAQEKICRLKRDKVLAYIAANR